MIRIANHQQSERRGARSLLRGMQGALSVDTLDLFSALEQGSEPEQVGRELGHRLWNALFALYEENSRLRQQWQDANQRCGSLSFALAGEAPLKVQIRETEMQLNQSAQEVGKLNQQIRELERERSMHLAEIGELQKTVADLNRLLADQHHQLLELLGEDYLPTNSEP